jgi:hypothetical protein
VRLTRRPPLDACDIKVGDCLFTVSADWHAAQIMLRGFPTGAGGGASLVPAPGVELVFDRADGQLSQLIVDVAGQGGQAEPSQAAIAYVRATFGDATAVSLIKAPRLGVRQVALRTEPDTAAALAALSRLARMRAARLTSPVPCSPLWAVEAAQLAHQAGPAGRHCGGAERPVTDVLMAGPPLTGLEPDAQPERCDRWPSGWLDPALIPVGVFKHGLSPESDLILCGSGAALIVEARLAGLASGQALGRCRARLIDSDARRVLACARFHSGGQRGEAALRVPAGLSAPGRYWLEAVDDEHRPVQGTRLRRIRRALRWADAALRAESRPAGLAPGLTGGQWAQLASHAWDQCRADWEGAGDADRAYLAAARRAAIAGEAPGSRRPPVPPSWWSDRLARRAVQPAPPFLAEEGGRRLPAVIGGFLDHHDYAPVVTGRAWCDEVGGAMPDDGQRGGTDAVRFEEPRRGFGAALGQRQVVSRGSRRRGVTVDHRGGTGAPELSKQRRQDTRGGREQHHAVVSEQRRPRHRLGKLPGREAVSDQLVELGLGAAGRWRRQPAGAARSLPHGRRLPRAPRRLRARSA